MPTYCYVCDACGRHREVRRNSPPRRLRCPHCAVNLRRDFRAEHSTMRAGNPWPRRSQALGVSPAQIPEAREHARRHGYQVDFDELGTALIPSRAEQNKMPVSYTHLTLPTIYSV